MDFPRLKVRNNRRLRPPGHKILVPPHIDSTQYSNSLSEPMAPNAIKNMDNVKRNINTKD